MQSSLHRWVLALFNIAGIQKSLECGFSFWVAIIMGCITGAAGGVIRDVLLNEEPVIFRKEIYAMACVAGGLAYWGFKYTSYYREDLYRSSDHNPVITWVNLE